MQFEREGENFNAEHWLVSYRLMAIRTIIDISNDLRANSHILFALGNLNIITQVATQSR